MLKYGSDKPDLRNPIEIAEATEIFRGSGFSIFERGIEKGGVVRAIPAPGGAAQPRSYFDRMQDWARNRGAGGLAYVTLDDKRRARARSRASSMSRAWRSIAGEATGAGPGDAVFFAADKPDKAAELAGAARNKLGEDLDLLEKGAFRFCWIVDFPMYERDAATGRVGFSHNPFSMPQGGLEALESMDPLEVKAFQYDIVCNGVELSSGAIRNHDPAIMYKAFEIAGYGPEVVEARFGGMLVRA